MEKSRQVLSRSIPFSVPGFAHFAFLRANPISEVEPGNSCGIFPGIFLLASLPAIWLSPFRTQPKPCSRKPQMNTNGHESTEPHEAFAEVSGAHDLLTRFHNGKGPEMTRPCSYYHGPVFPQTAQISGALVARVSHLRYLSCGSAAMCSFVSIGG